MIITSITRKNFRWFVGIDVSKHKLDFAVLSESEYLLHREIPNKEEDISKLCAFFKVEIPGFRLANTLFCMETTGPYSGILSRTLSSLKANFAVENALRIRLSSGLIRGKDDKRDALRIATYAQRFHREIKLWEPRRPILEQLKQLTSLRRRLIETALVLKTPLKEHESFFPGQKQKRIRTLCDSTIHALNSDIKNIDSEINCLIRGDERLNRLFELVTSVESIGRVTAIYIILATNEFLDIQCPKKFASYAGVAPFKHESGLTKRRGKVSPIANRKIKALLHLCAIGAVYRQPAFKAYFDKKAKAEGKAVMSVYNAIRYKLILRIFACVKQDRLYATNYIRPKRSPGEASMHFGSIQA